MKFLNHIDLSKTEIRNAVVQNLASAPSSPLEGQFYHDTVAHRLYYYNGTAWVLTATDTDKLGGQLPAYFLARANHTGTQLSTSISDLAATVQAYKLNQFAAPVASVDYNAQRITGLGDPVSAQDAATKNWVQGQVDNAAAGIDSKPSVRIVAISNITLSGLQSIDGITLVSGDRVLAIGQTTGSANGVYVAGSGAWTRALDADDTGEITPGAFWFVEEGTTYGKTQWRCNNTGTITIGTTSLTIVQFGAAALYTASLGVQLVGTDFRAQVVASGGVLSGSSGLQVDTAIVARKYSQTFGNGSLTSITITHSLGTLDVTTTIRDTTSGAIVYPDIVVTDINNVTISAAYAFGSAGYRATIIG